MSDYTPVWPVLEPAAAAFAESTAKPPYRHELPLSEVRVALDKVQSGDISEPSVHEEWFTILGGPTGSVRVRVLRPRGTSGLLPVILYLHGSGWVSGNAQTHDRLASELADGARAAVVFPEYDLSPEARYPTAIEQSYTVAQWLYSRGVGHGLDGSRFAVAGDGVGGNMAIALTLLAKERQDVVFTQQVLFYPVTDASFDTGSYHRFSTGYFLRRDEMQWFWDQYTPDQTERAQITASPLRATPDELAGLPPALVMTAEADVLRDEGEAFASKLRQAGVAVTAVRYQGVIHDFVMLNALRETNAAQGAIAQAVTTLRSALGTA